MEVRPVRGALSATLAARGCGLKSIAVPEPNAREAAVVDGVDVFALKSLPQAVDLVNAPESFQPVRVDAQLLLPLAPNSMSGAFHCAAVSEAKAMRESRMRLLGFSGGSINSRMASKIAVISVS